MRGYEENSNFPVSGLGKLMHCGKLIKTETEHLEEGINFLFWQVNTDFNFGNVGFEVFGVIQTVRGLTRGRGPNFKKKKKKNGPGIKQKFGSSL